MKLIPRTQEDGIREHERLLYVGDKAGADEVAETFHLDPQPKRYTWLDVLQHVEMALHDLKHGNKKGFRVSLEKALYILDSGCIERMTPGQSAAASLFATWIQNSAADIDRRNGL